MGTALIEPPANARVGRSPIDGATAITIMTHEPAGACHSCDVLDAVEAGPEGVLLSVRFAQQAAPQQPPRLTQQPRTVAVCPKPDADTPCHNVTTPTKIANATVPIL